jgi:hypothetical protein
VYCSVYNAATFSTWTSCLNDIGVDPIDACHLFKDKAEHKGFDPASFGTKFEARAPEYRKTWEEELSRYHLGDVPHYEEVERRLRRSCRSAGLL